MTNTIPDRVDGTGAGSSGLLRGLLKRPEKPARPLAGARGSESGLSISSSLQSRDRKGAVAEYLFRRAGIS